MIRPDLEHFRTVKDDNWLAEDGSMRTDYGVPFDRSDIWICRRCGSMVGKNQCASHAILHVDIDSATGKRG